MASKFSSEKLEEIRAQFDQFDADGNGHITCSEIAEVLKALGETTPGYKIRDMIREVDIDENGTIEFNEFVEMYAKVTAEKKTYGLQKTADKAKKLVQVGGLSEASAEDGEDLSDLMALSPEEILLRWFNYHLEEAGNPRRVHNFTKDIMDSECYTVLLNQIAPDDAGVDLSPLQEKDPEKRATLMLQQADKIGCKKFVRPKDVVKGNQRLNLAFVANLFNTYPALKPTEEGLPDFDLGDFGETREEKTFRNWMNSLGVNPFVNSLYQDLKDGNVLLQLFDKVKPGIVKWEKVNKPPYKMGGNMKKLENCNYAVDLGKQMGFSVVGIGGKDIFDGNKLTLAIIWQLMRAYTLAMLQKLSGSDKPIEEDAILLWTNTTLEEAGKTHTISGFKDQSISTSLPVIDLLDALRPGKVNYEIVLTAPSTDEII
ncbi:PREDICTED: plastin-2-like [Amphimedon queenslandica]|uniref:Uncharacterized protein n=2 Tax=Amphimedon queenslandica TaxID=400682 RepID=A0AAN0JRU1_AMPQE|nr:PREDICTED: plastin-2-like [Amphimedon queenslandica]|eukprot:XP_019859573.1 PREDICTED: plastin-2-like [Amphimedon queenslandica]